MIKIIIIILFIIALIIGIPIAFMSIDVLIHDIKFRKKDDKK